MVDVVKVRPSHYRFSIGFDKDIDWLASVSIKRQYLIFVGETKYE